MEPKVYLLVLCYNSKKWLETCLKTLLKTEYSNFKILLLDNASSDGSIQEAADRYGDKIEVLYNGANLGWCEGNNKGIRYSLNQGCEYIIFLNADIKADDPNWLRELVQVASNNNEYSILGCTQYEYDSEDWSELNSWTKYIMYLGNRDAVVMWDEAYGKPALEDVYTEEEVKGKGILECYFVQGAAMMVRSEVFERIGLFNPMYYMFYDEVDFCRKAKLAGMRIALVSQSRIKHVGSGHITNNKKSKRRRNFFYSRNKYLFVMTDVQKEKRRMRRIIFRLLKHDINDAIKRHEDIDNIIQFIQIWISIAFQIGKIKKVKKQLLHIKQVENKHR